jgi:holo-[acyl-carrier protein] synthase
MFNGRVMVYSVGIDLIEINRIKKGYKRFGERYLHRLFSADEIGLIRSKKSGTATTMAGKFAAKEAVMKSLSAFFDGGVTFRDIEILSKPPGMPYVRLPERVQRNIEGKKVLISISHEKKFALATAIITDEA